MLFASMDARNDEHPCGRDEIDDLRRLRLVDEQVRETVDPRLEGRPRRADGERVGQRHHAEASSPGDAGVQRGLVEHRKPGSARCGPVLDEELDVVRSRRDQFRDEGHGLLGIGGERHHDVAGPWFPLAGERSFRDECVWASMSPGSWVLPVPSIDAPVTVCASSSVDEGRTEAILVSSIVTVWFSSTCSPTKTRTFEIVVEATSVLFSGRVASFGGVDRTTSARHGRIKGCEEPSARVS
ncbi:hypothetical protein [Kineococcus sp. R86509]|uniref:hypothetical protein n=1 Tax=Kineococcus sp. R86509 TaxID=3093851 RepID=UPI0036D25A06